MQRRHFIASLIATVPLWRSAESLAQAAKNSAGTVRSLEQIRSDWKNFLPAKASLPSAQPPLTLSEDEWRKRLSPEQFKVLRQEGTERPGSSPLNAEKRRGVFACAGCDLPLFTSEMKFESGTGWPSFFTSIPGAFATKKDNLLIYTRTEYHCVRCGGHHGHVFDDGPPPTRERWCNNGVALKFLPA
ncbi:MAG TPA: peptide-methionine (R)-S-oxide reductase MsrB [Casimicrobiaceae bacterium]|nr:peptide-methionine (R)-S-oxide reductase MsrB [Casimicrobiaceae bacterium]